MSCPWFGDPVHDVESCPDCTARLEEMGVDMDEYASEHLPGSAPGKGWGCAAVMLVGSVIGLTTAELSKIFL